MSVDVRAEMQVDRPRAEVAAYMTDPANDPEWIGGVREARLVSDPPLAVGSRVARVASFLGRRIEYVNEIVRLEPARLEMRSVVAPFPMQITYEFEEHNSGTVVRNHVTGDPGRFFRLASPMLARLVRRSVQRDLERLRDVLERPV